MKKKVLVTLADSGFINQAKQLFASAYLQAGWDGDYLLLTSGLAPAERAWFIERGILVYDQPLLADSPLGKKACPPIHLSKLYLFTEYFKTWQQVFFLDADIIVRLPFARLFSPGLISAVWALPLLLQDEVKRESSLLLDPQYNFQRRAFSSGVMAIDTNLITPSTFTELLNFYRAQQANFPLNEESALNFFFYHKHRLAYFSYNAVPWLFFGAYGLREDKLAARILHFAYDKVKPWNPASRYFTEWLQNLRQAEEIDFSRPHRVRGGGLIFLGREIFQTYGTPFLATLNRQIGRFGLMLKHRLPGLYYFLKRRKIGK